MTRRLLRWVVLAYAALFALQLAYSQYHRSGPVPQDAVVVVLGAGQTPDGALGPQSLARLSAGLALAGRDHRLVFTGGHLDHEPRAVADLMAEAALATGMDPARLVIEPRSRSTLQNALFTADLLPPDTAPPVVLVSNRFHLMRARLSFRWAGYGEVHVFAADDPRGYRTVRGLLRIGYEAAVGCFNLARATAASAAHALGLPRDRYIGWLD